MAIFYVYWGDKIQTNIFVNQNGSLESSSPEWKLHVNGKTTFWLARNAPKHTHNSGNK